MRKRAGIILGLCLACILGPDVSQAADCTLSTTRCVGAGQEYGTIQSAVNAAAAGDTVLVMDGNYSGFSISRSGTSTQRIIIKTNGDNAVINRDGSGGNGVLIDDASNVEINGFRIQDVSGRCVAARNATATSPMTNVTIRNIVCQRSGKDGFYVSQLSNSLIENNYISATGLSGGSGGLESHGIYLANAGSKNTTMRNNTIMRDSAYPSYSGCIHMNGDLSIGGNGIISGAVIEDNQLIGCYDNGINMDGVQNSVFRNNLVFGNGRHALRGYRIDGAGGPKDLQIYNNTFVVPQGVDGWAIKLTSDQGGHTIFNNILLNEGSNGGSICVTSGSLVSNGNIVVNRMSLNGENSIISLSYWVAQTGQDTASTVGAYTSLFVDAPDNDYRLKDGSPAINTGLASLNSVNAPGSDIQGTARPQGTGYDIGAYEYIESTTAPAPPQNLHVIE